MHYDMRRKGTDLNSDSSRTVRMPRRPVASQNREGLVMDLGSDFASLSRSENNGKAIKNGPKHTSNGRSGISRGGREREPIPNGVSDSSEDELDFLSSAHSSPRGSQSRLASVTSQSHNSQDTHVQIDGKLHEYHPNYKPQNFKNMKFTKKKKVDDDTLPAVESSTSLPRKQKPSAPSSRPSHAKRHSPRGTLSRVDSLHEISDVSPAPSTSRLRKVTRSASKDKDSSRPLRDLSPNRTPDTAPVLVSSDGEDRGSDLMTPRPSRNKPRRPRTQDAPQDSRGDKLRKTYGIRNQGSEATVPLRKQGSGSDCREGKSKNIVKALDALMETKYLSEAKDEIISGPSRGKNGEKKMRDSSGDISPLSSPDQQDGSLRNAGKEKALRQFPMRSPPSSPVKRVPSSSQTDTSEAVPSSARSQVRPFPMEMQMLEDIGTGSPPLKRSSVDASDDEDIESTAKRRKKKPSELYAYISQSDRYSVALSTHRTCFLPDWRNSCKLLICPWMASAVSFDIRIYEELFLIARLIAVFLDPNVDPHTLCPWCDEVLPPVPTPYLLNLITMARASSYSDPRITNPLGLCGPPTAFVGVCQRHRFESHQIPKAKRKGWPMQVEWDDVPKRVKALFRRLREIVDDVDEEFLPGSTRRETSDEDTRRCESRPRLKSIFWKDLTNDVKKQGSRKIAGVKGQFHTFNRTQPG